MSKITARIDCGDKWVELTEDSFQAAADGLKLSLLVLFDECHPENQDQIIALGKQIAALGWHGEEAEKLGEKVIELRRQRPYHVEPPESV